jgi:hypothetical protein
MATITNAVEDTIDLGDLITLLRHQPANAEVTFDFAYFVPDALKSWRGDYSQLALGFRERSTEKPAPKVAEVLSLLQGALKKTFEGYKGGDYQMSERTPVWMDNWGEVSHTAIVGVQFVDGYVVLQTWRMSY